MKEASKKDREGLFTRAYSGRTRGNISYGPMILFIFLMLCVNEVVHVVQQHACSHSPLKVQVMGSCDSCVLAFTPGKTGNVRVKELVCVPFAQVQISGVHITAQGDWKCSKVPQFEHSLKDKNTQGFCYFVFMTYLYLDPIQTKIERKHKAAFVLPALQ